MIRRAGDLALTGAAATLLFVVGVTLLVDNGELVSLTPPLARALGGVYIAVAVAQVVLAIRRR